MQHAMIQEQDTVNGQIPTSTKGRPDLVKWGVQLILLALVSPALLAVLLIGGVCVSVQKIANVGERIFASTPSRLNAASAHSKV